MSTADVSKSKIAILALDTSGPRLQLALFVRGQITILCEDIVKGHAEILFDRLAVFLAEHQITYQDLNKIVVTTGPGSFTGLRIGIAAARGLGLALDVPVIGVPNLLALSLKKPTGAFSIKDPFSIIVDARRNQFYVQEFIAPAVPKNVPQLVEADDLEKREGTGSPDIQQNPQIDMVRLMQFAQGVTPSHFPPVPTYIRAADAKPQSKLRIARL